MKTYDLRNKIKNLNFNKPVFCITGEKDILAHKRFSKWMAENYKNGSYYIVPDDEHNIDQHKPLSLRKKIDEFLDFFGIEEAFLTQDLDPPELTQPVVNEKDFDILQEYRTRSGISDRDIIEKLLEIIRPELKRDGGDIKVLEFKDNVLKIQLLGACRACYMADVVMIRYLEHLIRKYISDDVIVENVNMLID